LEKQKAAAVAAQTLQCRIYIGNLPQEFDEEELRRVFAVNGPVKTVNWCKDPITQKSRGFCFLDYMFPAAAQMAMKNMNGYVFQGQ
jgi:RNA recognition motif-containing protein